MINSYGFKLSPWMMPWLIWIGDVVEKWALLIKVEDSA